MKRGIAIGMVAMGLGVMCFVLAGRMAKLRAENEMLRAELHEERLITAEFARSAQGARKLGGGETSHEEKLELMRLRNEVTQLRASAEAAREAVKNALENKDLGMQRAATGNDRSQTVIGMELQKEQWGFRGYATPEDAVVSAMWALGNGDLLRVAESMAAGDHKEWQDQRARSSDDAVQSQIQREFGDLTALKITGQKEVSPTKMLVDVVMHKPQQISTRQVHVYREGNEWKMQSLINVYDPLAFYRRNPELMKRYFPHLFREEVPQQLLPPNEAPRVDGEGTLPPEPSPNE